MQKKWKYEENMQFYMQHMQKSIYCTFCIYMHSPLYWWLATSLPHRCPPSNAYAPPAMLTFTTEVLSTGAISAQMDKRRMQLPSFVCVVWIELSWYWQSFTWRFPSSQDWNLKPRCTACPGWSICVRSEQGLKYEIYIFPWNIHLSLWLNGLNGLNGIKRNVENQPFWY